MLLYQLTKHIHPKLRVQLPAKRALRGPWHVVEVLHPVALLPRRGFCAKERCRILLAHLQGHTPVTTLSYAIPDSDTNAWESTDLGVDGQRGALCLLPALRDGEEGVEAHAEDGDEDAGEVAEREGVFEQDVAEGEDEARLEVAQHLVRHWRRRADHQEGAEVDGHRDPARHQDEHLRPESWFSAVQIRSSFTSASSVLAAAAHIVRTTTSNVYSNAKTSCFVRSLSTKGPVMSSTADWYREDWYSS